MFHDKILSPQIYSTDYKKIKRSLTFINKLNLMNKAYSNLLKLTLFIRTFVLYQKDKQDSPTTMPAFFALIKEKLKLKYFGLKSTGYHFLPLIL